MVATVVETNEVEKWLFSTLSLDSIMLALIGSRIYESVAPPETDYPYVVYQYSGGHDVQGIPSVRVMTRTEYLVKAITNEPNSDALVSVVKRIDELLHGASGAVGATGYVLSCVRVHPVSLLEIDAGIQYRHRGGVYQIQVQPQ